MRQILLSVLTIGVVSAFAYGTTLAYFTSQDANKDNHIEAGTLTIVIDELLGDSLPFNVTAMVPGAHEAKCFGVSNAGSLPFDWEYTLVRTGESSPSLHDVLKARLYSWVGSGVPDEVACAAENETDWDLLGEDYLTAWVYPYSMGGLGVGEESYYKLEVYLEDNLHTAGGDVFDDDFQGSWVEYTVQVDADQQL